MARSKSLFLALALVSGLAQTVSAADLPRRPAPAPLMSPTPVYNWTGIYLGLNGGGGWGQQDPLNLITNRFDRASVDFSGGVFGAPDIVKGSCLTEPGQQSRTGRNARASHYGAPR